MSSSPHILVLGRNFAGLTTARHIREYAGETILDELLPMVDEMGFGDRAEKKGIKRLYDDGSEFDDGSSEAGLKIIFPNWTAHDIVKNPPITDDQGFVVTDLHTRNKEGPEPREKLGLSHRSIV